MQAEQTQELNMQDELLPCQPHASVVRQAPQQRKYKMEDTSLQSSQSITTTGKQTKISRCVG